MKKHSFNPEELARSRKRRRAISKAFIVSISSGLALALTFWFLVNFPKFYFKEITLNLGEAFEKEKIIQSLREKILGKSTIRNALGFNYLPLWPRSLSGGELGIPEIENLEIRKNYLNQALVINVVERQVSGIWCFRSDAASAPCWLFDSEGRLFKESPVTGGNIIKVVNDYSQTKSEATKKILPDRLIPNMLSILEVVSKLSLSVKDIKILDLDLFEVEVIPQSGPAILFSLRRPAFDYYEVLKSLISKKDFNNLEYIDLRTENRVFTSPN